MTAPLLSFIVLSYNYEKYIGQTLRSILDQTVQDFEVVVVDDASRDGSREVVSGFNDPRIRLLVNDQNLGGAGSYNRAVSAARGEWLVNLDADDWIAPEKSAAQLDAVARDPRLDIIGTHVSFVDAEGRPHPQAEVMEAQTNKNLDLNRVESWVGHNSLCRSSTMVRRAAHLRIGMDDATMVRAPDYELWTRALRHGCRFGVISEPLTFYRLHARGVTFGDPRGALLELSYAMLRNLLPLIEARAMWPSYFEILHWISGSEATAKLSLGERYRLLGSMLMPPDAVTFAQFRELLEVDGGDKRLADAGRRGLALVRNNTLVDRLRSDREALMEARNWWRDQADRLEGQADRLESDTHALMQARDWWRDQSDRWESVSHQHERAIEELSGHLAASRDQSDHWEAVSRQQNQTIEELEAASRQQQQTIDELSRRLEDILRWTPASLGRAALSRFYRS